MTFDFIVVHEQGEERIVNTRWVETILPKKGRALICFAIFPQFNMAHEHIWTDESYDAVKLMIWR